MESNSGPTGPGMKASGRKVKPVGQVGSSTPMVIAMRAFGGMGKLVAREYMCTQMAADILANFMPITRTGSEGKSGQTELCSKVSF